MKKKIAPKMSESHDSEQHKVKVKGPKHANLKCEKRVPMNSLAYMAASFNFIARRSIYPASVHKQHWVSSELLLRQRERDYS